MPPRYAYWTIIAGGLPTAFRAADRDELLPTFRRIRDKHPDAEMKWFARGKLWDSPEAARVRRDAHREGRRTDHRPARPSDHDRQGASAEPPGSEKRSRDWRPGGEHRDPRQKFIGAKKQRNAVLRKERWERKAWGQKPGLRGQGSGSLRELETHRGRTGASRQEGKPISEPPAPAPPDAPVKASQGPPKHRTMQRRPSESRGHYRKGPRR